MGVQIKLIFNYILTLAVTSCNSIIIHISNKLSLKICHNENLRIKMRPPQFHHNKIFAFLGLFTEYLHKI